MTHFIWKKQHNPVILWGLTLTLTRENLPSWLNDISPAIETPQWWKGSVSSCWNTTHAQLTGRPCSRETGDGDIRAARLPGNPIGHQSAGKAWNQYGYTQKVNIADKQVYLDAARDSALCQHAEKVSFRTSMSPHSLADCLRQTPSPSQ